MKNVFKTLFGYCFFQTPSDISSVPIPVINNDCSLKITTLTSKRKQQCHIDLINLVNCAKFYNFRCYLLLLFLVLKDAEISKNAKTGSGQSSSPLWHWKIGFRLDGLIVYFIFLQSKPIRDGPLFFIEGRRGGGGYHFWDLQTIFF